MFNRWGRAVKDCAFKRPLSGIQAALTSSGIWSVHTWVFCFAIIGSREGFLLPLRPSWYLLYLGMMASLTVIAVTSARSATSRDKRAIYVGDFAAAAAMCFSSFLVFSANISDGTGQSPTFIASCLVGGAGVAWMYARWLSELSRFEMRAVVSFLLTACVVGAAVKIAVTLLPTFGVFGVSVLLGPSSAYLVHRTGAMTSNTTEEPKTADFSFSAMAPALLCVLALTTVHSMLYGTYETSVSEDWLLSIQAGRVIEMLIALFFTAWVFVHGGSFGFGQLWATISFIIGSGMAVALSWDSAILSFALEEAAGDLIVLCYQLVLVDVARYINMRPMLTVSLGWILYTVARLVAGLLYGTASSGWIGSGQVPTVFSFMLITVLAVDSFCLVSRSPFILRVFSEMDGTTPAPDYYDVLEARCAEIARDYGLTEREATVAQLLCKGRSKAFIAESMGVSENTVRGHAKRVYLKLDIHSRHELQDLVGVR